MPLIATFAGVEAKLRRANAHLEVINDEIGKFNASDPYHFFTEYDEVRQQMVARAKAVIHPDEELWATVIGDCVHNFRSALDHLAHPLLTLAGETPKTGRGGTAFPIYDTCVGPKGGPRTPAITGESGAVGGPVLAFVKGVQPYERVDDPDQHPLWVLSELDNMDKHRALTTTSFALQDFSLGKLEMWDVAVHFDHIGFVGAFNEKTELARWSVTPTGPDPHMNVGGNGATDVAFDSSCGPAADRLVLPTLDEIKCYVTNIIEVLKVKAWEGGF